MSSPSPSPASPDSIDPSPIRELLRIALPSIAATTSYTLMQFVDKLMVSYIGPDPVYVGAQGSGGLAAWIPISFMYGVLAVVNTFVSQNLGAGQSQRGPAYAWNALWLALIFAILLIPYGFSLPWLFALMGYDQQRIDLACDYGQIMVFGAFITMSTRGIGQYFYGMQRPKVVMTASIAGNITNLCLNWILIFGHFGFPALGLQGAAIATLIGSMVEALIPFSLFLGKKMNHQYATRAAWPPHIPHMRDIFRIGWPAGAMFGTEMISWGFFMLYLVGSTSKEASTAAFVAQQWMSLSFMPTVGLGIAVTSTVGKYIGMKRPDLAHQRAMVGVKVAMTYMGLCGVLFVFCGHYLVDPFMPDSTPPEDRARVLDLGIKFLYACAAFQIFDAIAVVLGGALRGASDTKFLGVATLILSASILIGGGWITVTYIPQWGAVGPWIAAAAYIMLLALVSVLRYRGGKWKTMSVVDKPDSPNSPNSPGSPDSPLPPPAIGHS